MGDVKNFLYAWCGKKKVTPSYEIRTAGNKNRQKFSCEVRVDGFNYTGMGNSTSKKDAQSNAARDFVNYLVRIGEVKSSEVPTFVVGEGQGLGVPAGGFEGSSGPLPPHLAIKKETGELPVGSGFGGGASWERGANLKDYYSKKEEQENEATLESEEVDLNAGLHGNWTLDNAKARLNQFFQKEKTQAEYKYTQVGPDHNRFARVAYPTLHLPQWKEFILSGPHILGHDNLVNGEYRYVCFVLDGCKRDVAAGVAIVRDN